MKYILFFTFLVFAFPVYAEAQDSNLAAEIQANAERDPCVCDDDIDPHERWEQLNKEKQELLSDPQELSKYCAECKAECAQDGESDPLRKWKCIQCNNDCSSLNTENEE